jgi:predicted nucleotidyltransferase
MAITDAVSPRGFGSRKQRATAGARYRAKRSCEPFLPMKDLHVSPGSYAIIKLMESDAEQLNELVRRIVEAVQPLRIILFGSAARGEMGTDSDVDVLVVMPENAPRRRTAQYLHTRLFGIPFAVDILVATPSMLEKHKDNIGLVYRQILAEGRELYAA